MSLWRVSERSFDVVRYIRTFWIISPDGWEGPAEATGDMNPFQVELSLNVFDPSQDPLWCAGWFPAWRERATKRGRGRRWSSRYTEGRKAERRRRKAAVVEGQRLRALARLHRADADSIDALRYAVLAPLRPATPRRLP